MTGEAFLDLCRSRRSCREYSMAPLEPSQVEAILAAARTAPYASGRKGWDVLVVDDRDAIARAATAVEEAAAKWRIRVRPDLRDEWDAYAAHFRSFSGAPALFLPVFRPAPSLSALLETADPEAEAFDRENHLKSISGATTLIVLAAQSLGLGACPMTGPLLARSELEALFRVPRGRELAAVVAVGTPAS